MMVDDRRRHCQLNLYRAKNGPGAGSAITRPRPTSISLPNGGGAIGDIGEKFAANPVTGMGSMSVPIATSPGIPISGPGRERMMVFQRPSKPNARTVRC
jgi:hypothetical protein